MSALNLNKVILVGRLVADPELKKTQGGGISVTSFTVAVNRRRQQDKPQEADFISVVAWRQLAEFICRYFKKGNSICIQGSIQSRSYETTSHEKRYVTEVVAEEARFVDSKSDNSGNASASYMPEAYQNAPQLEEVANDDDLPF